MNHFLSSAWWQHSYLSFYVNVMARVLKSKLIYQVVYNLTSPFAYLDLEPAAPPFRITNYIIN